MTLDKQAVERGAKVLFAVTADQINRDPNGYDQLPEHSKEQVRTATRAVLETATIAALVPQEEEVGRMVERLRARDAAWQNKCDGWIAQAPPDQPVSAEQERIIRHTWEAEAADLFERLVGIQGK